MSSLTATKEKDFRLTDEWKTIWEKHEEMVEKGTSSIVEIEPIHSRVFGNVHMKATIKDKYGNIVYSNKEGNTRLGFNGHGVILRYEVEEHLRAIYAVKNCPSVQRFMAFSKEEADPQSKRFLVKDVEAISTAYATEREDRVKHQGQIYQESEDVINLLCTLVGLPTASSLNTKRALLCEEYEGNKVNRAKIVGMMRSEDKRFYVAAYKGLADGLFTQTQSGVYKHNEQVLGNHIDKIVVYLKETPDVYTLLEKGKQLVEQSEAVAKSNAEAAKKPK